MPWGKLGVGELLIILLIVLVLFGANRLPELARSIGRSVNELKEGLKGKPQPPAAAAEEDQGKK
ncbi:Sec-independent protein translocase subunit TatA/TatB [Candidatus Darwinibacter acetoxidans]